MKLFCCLIMVMMSVVDAIAADKKDFIYPKYEWVVEEGNVCMVVFPPQSSSSLVRKTYYFNQDGEMKAVLLEDLDSPGSSRPVILSTLYAFDKSHQVIGAKCINYTYEDGGKVVPYESIYNNYALLKSKKVNYRDGRLNSVAPTKRDKKGNWVEGETLYGASSMRPIMRKIYYYGDEIYEKKAYAMLAEVDSLTQYCKENGWSVAERSNMERKSSHGFWWNLLLPALVSALISYLVFRLFYLKRKVSNLVIMLLAAGFIYIVGDYILIPFGPYGALWTLLYWMISIGVAGLFLPLLLAIRCPRCGAYGDNRTINRLHKTTSKKKIATHEDGEKEVLSSSVERITIDTYCCNECGCTWKHTFWGGHYK